MDRFCPHCGTSLSGAARYCKGCGMALNVPREAAAGTIRRSAVAASVAAVAEVRPPQKEAPGPSYDSSLVSPSWAQPMDPATTAVYPPPVGFAKTSVWSPGVVALSGVVALLGGGLAGYLFVHLVLAG